MSTKTAFLNSDPINTTKWYLGQYGLPSAGIGIAGAVASHLYAEHKRKQEEKEMFGDQDNDPGMIRIKVPSKVAETNPALAGIIDSVNKFREKVATVIPNEDSLFKDTAIGLSTLGVGGLSYGLTDYLLKGLEKRRVKKDLSGAKDDYMDLVYRDIGARQGLPAKTASFPVLCGLIESTVDRLEEKAPYDEVTKKKIAEWPNPLIGPTAAAVTSAPVALGILSMINSYRNSLHSERNVDEYLRQKSRKAPLETRVVIDSAEPEGVKTAAMTLPQVQPVVPAETLATKAKIKVDQAKQLLPKQAEYAESLPDGMPAEDQMTLGRQIEREQAIENRTEDLSRKHPIIKSSDSSLTINTPQGPVTIDALDPRAMRYLKSNPEALRTMVNTPAIV